MEARYYYLIKNIFSRYSGTPLVRQPLCARNMAFREGWPLVRVKNQYIYALMYMYIVIWPSQRGWPLLRVASQEVFHCTCISNVQYIAQL